MIKINSFGVIGGDKRQLMMTKSMIADGYRVQMAGFDTIETLSGLWNNTTFDKAINDSEVLILPLPVTKDGKNLNAPYSSEAICIDDNFAEKISGKMVFCGMSESLLNLCPTLDKKLIHDYMRREEFAVQNAVPTGEGAIEIAMREYSGTINGSKCLVIGYGRIGKVLVSMLNGLGARVTVAARKKHDLAWAEIYGCRTISTDRICENSGYDVVFNTVPHMILDAHTLAKTCENAVVIDLASAPGGVDVNAAKRLNIRLIHALSLPGRIAPKAAGEIIKNTVYNILEEEYK